MNKIKEFIVPTATLFIICLVASVLLGLTNKVTAPRIEQIAYESKEGTWLACASQGICEPCVLTAHIADISACHHSDNNDREIKTAEKIAKTCGNEN